MKDEIMTKFLGNLKLYPSQDSKFIPLKIGDTVLDLSIEKSGDFYIFTSESICYLESRIDKGDIDLRYVVDNLNCVASYRSKTNEAA